MNSRDRVWTALRRTGLPDRVPLQFDLSRQIIERYSVKYGIAPQYTPAYYEDVTYRLSANELRVAMGSDCVIVGASLPRGYSHPMDANGHVTNEFGMVMRQGPVYMEVLDNPLADVKDPAQVEDFRFPDPLADGRYDDAAKFIDKYKGEYFIWGDMELTMLDMMQFLVGLEKLLTDMAMGESYVEILIDKCKDFALAVGKKLVTLGVDGIWAGDDFGAQSGMLISPRMWKRYFKERYRQIYGELKARNSDLVMAQHCDGAVAPILGEWIEVGLEVFNPVQPNVAGHEPEDLKGQFGDRLSFWGGIDQQQLLPFGTPEEIEAEVKRRIEILGEGGGYMVAPAHIIQADTPDENIEAFISAVKVHGTYA